MPTYNPECFALLRAQDLFADLSDDELARVAELAEEHAVSQGTLLSRQADRGETYFLIGEGEAVVHRVDEQGLQRPVGVLGPGSAYGITSLFLGEPRDATITAVTPLVAWSIASSAFQDLLERHPEMEVRLRLPEAARRKLETPLLPWLEPLEVIALLTRRHWTVFVVSALWTTGICGLCVALLTLVGSAAGNASDLTPWFVAVSLVWVAVLGWQWLDWRNDYLVVTTHRIVHHERVALVYESRHEAPLDRVQNVHLRRGFLATLVGYGDLTVETAAQAGRIEFRRAPRPEAVRDAIFEQLARARAARRAAERHRIEEELVERIGTESPHTLPPDAGRHDRLERTDPVAGSGAAIGRLAGVLGALGRSGLLPRTRIETAEGILWRRHWAFLLGATLQPLVLLGLLVALAILGLSGRPAALVEAIPSTPVISLVLAVGAVGWLAWRANDWANDLYMVTDERIVDIDRRPLFFHEDRREATLGVIQNVWLEMPGPIAALLNYGDVIVATAGAGQFTFHRVANPREVQQEIFRRMEAYRQREREREADRRRSELAEWLTVYDKLRHSAEGRGEAHLSEGEGTDAGGGPA